MCPLHVAETYDGWAHCLHKFNVTWHARIWPCAAGIEQLDGPVSHGAYVQCVNLRNTHSRSHALTIWVTLPFCDRDLDQWPCNSDNRRIGEQTRDISWVKCTILFETCISDTQSQSPDWLLYVVSCTALSGTVSHGKKMPASFLLGLAKVVKLDELCCLYALFVMVHFVCVRLQPFVRMGELGLRKPTNPLYAE